MSGDGSGSPLSVTLIGSVPPARGISPYVMALARALDRRDDIDLEVLSFGSMYPSWLYPGGRSDSGDADAPRDLAVQRMLSWWNPISWISAGLSLRGDVVHAQWWSWFLAPAYVTTLAIARLRRKRVVISLHNVDPHERGLMRRLANAAVLPLAHRIIVHAEANRAVLAGRGVDAGRIEVIPMGIGPAAHADTPVPTRADARERLGLPNGAPIVLFFGNIRPYKGVDVLIDAFDSVAASLPEARLVIAGQPWRDASEALERRITRAHPNVIARLGFVPDDDVPAYYAAADVVVFPYIHFEAQSAAACDALAHRRAIVVTDAGGLPELVDDQRAVVPRGDAPALARALVRVLSDGDLRRRLEEGAARRARELGWGGVAALTTRVYSSIRRLDARGRDITAERPGPGVPGVTAAAVRGGHDDQG